MMINNAGIVKLMRSAECKPIMLTLGKAPFNLLPLEHQRSRVQLWQ
jgi:hypothetical protein